MSEGQNQAPLKAIYKRAGIGLAVAALSWLIVSALWPPANAREPIILIPIGAVALSLFCFARYFRTK